MAKTSSCPQCGSKKIKLQVPQTSIWKCQKCGYQGSIVIEDGNLEKQIKEAKKMEKLQKNFLEEDKLHGSCLLFFCFLRFEITHIIS